MTSPSPIVGQWYRRASGAPNTSFEVVAIDRDDAAIVDAMKPLMLGKSALATDLIWQTLYDRWRDLGQKGLTVAAIVVTALAAVELEPLARRTTT